MKRILIFAIFLSVGIEADSHKCDLIFEKLKVVTKKMQSASKLYSNALLKHRPTNSNLSMLTGELQSMKYLAVQATGECSGEKAERAQYILDTSEKLEDVAICNFSQFQVLKGVSEVGEGAGNLGKAMERRSATLMDVELLRIKVESARVTANKLVNECSGEYKKTGEEGLKRLKNIEYHLNKASKHI